MKGVKSIAPIVLNIIICFIFKICMRKPLVMWLGGDMCFYIDGRADYNFGVGSASIAFILLLLIITVAWILRNAKMYQVSESRKKYIIVSIVLVLIVDVFWLAHYYNWYLLGLPGFVFEFYIYPFFE